ncbi:halovibrin HvnC [Pseudomonas sp. AF32]|uniref:halovibrin HvnC n=1 Tax=Pseudomonas sp. AF32 TaxID=554390 RepID=UPI001EED8C97|nr:halovibrin HvnC [Pseudomonas sp. AF32]MCG6574739.1 halovibrin HvnC [Pseudomonas sp. AF32]
MKAVFYLSGLGLLAVCHQVSAQWVAGNSESSLADGSATLMAIRGQYFNVVENCGTNNRPAFLCSGVTLRVTKKSDRYRVWDPSPPSQQRGGVAFSYLRADAKFQTFAWGYNNGYILYPKFSAPADKLSLGVVCSFPMDSWDWHRDALCGRITLEENQHYEVSRPCQSQGIVNSDQWANHWNQSVSTNAHLDQCGFDVASGTANGAVFFYESLKAKQKINGFYEWNEIQVATWPQGSARTLPLQAFFYSDPVGLADARSNQKEFYTDTGGIVVPIIKVTLPSTVSQDTVFDFQPSDQEVTAGQATTPPSGEQPWIVNPLDGAAVTSPFRISGKSASGATVDVCLEGGWYCFGAPAVADGNGYWFIDGAQLNPGSYKFTARQTSNGQVSSWTANRTLTVQ